jgi:hypothetical protein
LQFNTSLKFLKGYGWKLLQSKCHRRAGQCLTRVTDRNSQIVFFLSTIFSYLFVATGFIFVSENSITASEGQARDCTARTALTANR